MNPDEVKELLLCVIEDAHDKYRFKLKHYTIMSNHIHMLIEPGPGTSLSKLMQWILATFAIRFNRMFNLIGHVWYDRFKSVIISSFIQLINTFQYISDNPVKAGISNNAKDYVYSGLYELKRNRLRVVDPPDELVKLLFLSN